MKIKQDSNIKGEDFAVTDSSFSFFGVSAVLRNTSICLYLGQVGHPLLAFKRGEKDGTPLDPRTWSLATRAEPSRHTSSPRW